MGDAEGVSSPGTGLSSGSTSSVRWYWPTAIGTSSGGSGSPDGKSVNRWEPWHQELLLALNEQARAEVPREESQRHRKSPSRGPLRAVVRVCLTAPRLRASLARIEAVERDSESGTARIVGREVELEVLDGVVRGDAGGVVLALIEGEAGIGKTVLWSEVAARARVAGVRVLAARPTAAEAASSYATLDELLQSVLAVVRGDGSPRRRALAAALLLEPSQAPPEARAVALGLVSVIDELESERRLLLAIDDWQWMDAASAAVLVFAMRRLPAGRAALLATVRLGEADDAVAALVRSLPPDSVVELPLAPLDSGALRELIQARTGRWLAPTELRRLQESSRRRCAGCPRADAR